LHDALPIYRLLDVLRPALVIIDRVDAEPQDLAVALVELGLDLGHIAQLGRAHWRKVLGVREDHAPAVAHPVIESDSTGGRIGFEIGRRVVDLQSHGTASPQCMCERAYIHDDGARGYMHAPAIAVDCGSGDRSAPTPAMAPAGP